MALRVPVDNVTRHRPPPVLVGEPLAAASSAASERNALLAGLIKASPKAMFWNDGGVKYVGEDLIQERLLWTDQSFIPTRTSVDSNVELAGMRGLPLRVLERGYRTNLSQRAGFPPCFKGANLAGPDDFTNPTLVSDLKRR